MNKTDFLKQLEDELSTLPEAERQAALQFYTDYIDDAQSQRIFDELGDPKVIAQRILGEIPHLDDDDFTIQDEPTTKTNELTQLKVSAEFASIMIKRGSSYHVSTKGMVAEDLVQEVKDSIIVIKETNKWRSFLNFISRISTERVIIDITIPPSVEYLDVSTLSGRIEIEDLGAKKVIARTETGRLVLQRCTIQNLKASSSVAGVTLESCTITDCSLTGQIGALKTNSSSFTNLDIRGDVAPVEIQKSSILRSLMIRSTVGPVTVHLEQPLAQCQVVVDSSIGNVTINGVKKKVHFVAKPETTVHVKQDIGPVTIALE